MVISKIKKRVTAAIEDNSPGTALKILEDDYNGIKPKFQTLEEN